LSLDKWLRPAKKKKPEIKEEKKPIDQKKIPQLERNKVSQDEKTVSSLKNWQKYKLFCPKKSCKYQKIKLVGKNSPLKEKDKICPRCKGELKIKEV